MDNHRKKNIIMTMFWYWIIIIVWQYVRPVSNRSLLDTLVKMCMFGLIVWYAVRNGKGLKLYGKTGIGIIIYFLTQIITIVLDSRKASTGNLITIAFMFIEIVIFLIMLNFETITEEQLTKFCKCLLAVAVIMCFYNMAFHTSRFMGTFSAGGYSYGRECKSFLYSNHEFGIYLSAAIISSCWLTIRGKLNKLLFLACGLLMGVNLLSTYSRTAIIGCIAALFILLFFYSKPLFTGVAATFCGGLVYISQNEKLNAIVFDKIMKGSFENGQVMDEGRSSMYEDEFQHFVDGDFFHKMFGYGYAGKEQFSGHDAYLVILLTGGIIMFIFFIMILLMGMNYAFKTMQKNKSIGSLMIGYIVFCVLYMIAQTPILFYSSMDSFFITMLAVIIPKYVYNHYYGPTERKADAVNIGEMK